MAVGHGWTEYNTFVSYFRVFKLGCITNFDMLFLMMGFISLVDEIQFMLINSHHICIRSMAEMIKVCFLLSSEQ